MSHTGRFQVYIDGLGALGDRLVACEAEMREASRSLSRASTRDMGSLLLDAACESFQSSWSYGIEQISSWAATLHDGISTTVRTYSETDAAIRDAFAQASNDRQGGEGVSDQRHPSATPTPQTWPFG